MHDISLCIYCNEKLKKIKPEKLEVMHCIQINIASEQHPEVPYFVLQLKDEKGNLYFRKSKKPVKEGELINEDN
jgi:hypothetical protein